MTSLAEIRTKYPQYNDMSDVELADGMYAKFYSDMDKGEFYNKIGFSNTPTEEQAMKNAATGAQATNPIAALTGYTANAMQVVPFADEVGSGIAAALGAGDGDTIGDRYNNLQKSQQAMRKAGKELYPVPTIIGQVGAGLASLKAFPLSKAKAAPTFLGRMHQTGKTVAPIMATYGASENDAFKKDNGILDNSYVDRAKNALTYGGAGYTFGLAAPVVAEPIVWGASKVKPLLSMFYKPLKSSEKIAAKQIENIVGRDKLDVANLPVDKNMLQAGGRAATSRAEAIATRENPASDAIVKYAEERKLDLPKELPEYLGNTFEEGNYPAILEKLKQETYARAKPGYKAAYDAADRIIDPEINQALDRVVRSGRWGTLSAEAKEIAALEGETLGNIDATGVIRSFSTKDLDYMTRALRNLGQSTEGKGAMGSNTPVGGLRKKIAAQIRSRLGEINPKFAEVTRQFADDVAIREAAETGKSANIFGSNWKQAAQDYLALPNEVAKKAWRIGQAENLSNMMQRNPTAALKLFNSPQFKKSMSVFYSPDELSVMTKKLSERMTEANNIQRITSNSRTAARIGQQADDAALSNGGIGELAGDVIRSGAKRTFLNRTADAAINAVTNTPRLQQADKLVTDQLLATPFQRAGQEAAGNLPKEILQALVGKSPQEQTKIINYLRLLQAYEQPITENTIRMIAATNSN